MGYADITTPIRFASLAVTSTAVSLLDFSGVTAADVQNASLATLSIVGGNVNIRWDGTNPTGAAGGGIRLVGLPSAGVQANAVFQIEGGNAVANLRIIAETGSTPTVNVMLEG